MNKQTELEKDIEGETREQQKIEDDYYGKGSEKIENNNNN